MRFAWRVWDLHGELIVGHAFVQAIHVGDDLETDIRGGNEAGLAATVWVNASGAEPPPHQSPPTYTVAHVTEVLSILENLIPT
jgi:FMN phosphatase YigB (HAD superfamily)